MGCGNSNKVEEPEKKEKDDSIDQGILDKIDKATELHEKIGEGMEKGVEFC